MKFRPLDEVDSKILRILLDNSRASISEISSDLGLSRPTIRRRIRSLEERGIIKRFTIEIDDKILGGKLFVIALDSNKPEEAAKKLEEIGSVTDIFITTGTPNIVAVVRISSMEELDILTKTLADINPSFDVKIAFGHIHRPLTFEKLAKLGLVTLLCDYCSKKITGEPLTYTAHNRKYYFCCPTCLREFVKKQRKK